MERSNALSIDSFENLLYFGPKSSRNSLKKKDREDARLEEIRRKHQEEQLLCRAHILNHLSDRLYNLYSSTQSPTTIWSSLEAKYTNEKQGTDKFLMIQ